MASSIAPSPHTGVPQGLHSDTHIGDQGCITCGSLDSELGDEPYSDGTDFGDEPHGDGTDFGDELSGDGTNLGYEPGACSCCHQERWLWWRLVP